ncbi:MAG: hypothetical protein LBU87_01445 [Lactobacillales bacterium]|jgi:hypothetical protein|nr:hypothetical protein [Lactobacillales bacterium]
MKNFYGALILGLLLLSNTAQAQERTAKGLSEAQQLGITAGLAQACNAGGKLDDFELIASRIIANQALTQKEEMDGYRAFATSKLQALREHKDSPKLTCGEVLDDFGRLPIFKSVVYADGSVKMPDGTMLRPKRPVTQTAKKSNAAGTQKTQTPKTAKSGGVPKKITPKQTGK